MNILVTGGFGAIGYQLLKSLRNVYEKDVITCIDLSEGFEFEEDFESEEHKYDESPDHSYLMKEIIKSDIIVHLAENTCQNNYPVSAIQDNVVFASNVLYNAAKYGKRVVVPCWLEFENIPEFSPWIASIKWRSELATMFNYGNAVITPLYLPRVISPFHFSRTYGNLVKRFYRAARISYPAEITQIEITFDSVSGWCTIDEAIVGIITAMRSRSRARQIIKSHAVTPLSLAEFIAWKTGVEYIEVAENKDKENKRIFANHESLQNEKIKQAVCEAIDIWDRFWDAK